MTSVIKQMQNNSDTYYCKMPDGTLIQHGSVGVYQNATRATHTVTFPVAFSSDTYHMVATGRYYSDANTYEGMVCTVKHNSTSTAEIHVRNTTGNYLNTVEWFAIGRWK